MGEIMDFATSAVRNGAVDVIYTDQMASYRIFDGVFAHKPVNHVVSFVDGDIHTNGIEGFWSLLKRGINGAFHHVSAKHLPRYLDEVMWRFNNRRSDNIVDKLLASCECRHVRYAELTA